MSLVLMEGMSWARTYRRCVAINLGVSVTSPGQSTSLVIAGVRTTIDRRSGVAVTGTSTGLNGAVVTPRIRVSGQVGYRNGSARRLIDDQGEFAWQRRGGKKIYVYFRVLDSSERSNRIIIPRGSR